MMKSLLTQEREPMTGLSHCFIVFFSSRNKDSDEFMNRALGFASPTYTTSICTSAQLVTVERAKSKFRFGDASSTHEIGVMLHKHNPECNAYHKEKFLLRNSDRKSKTAAECVLPVRAPFRFHGEQTKFRNYAVIIIQFISG